MLIEKTEAALFRVEIDSYADPNGLRRVRDEFNGVTFSADYAVSNGDDQSEQSK